MSRTKSEKRAYRRADLAEAVYRSVKTTRGESAEMVDVVLNEIVETLSAGDNVHLSGFGIFEVRLKKERMGRNPGTMVDAPISARRIVAFKPSAILKGRMNGKAARVKRRPE